MSEKLSTTQLEALTKIARFNGTSWLDPKQLGFGVDLPHGHPLQQSYRVWNALTSLGYLERLDNSEQTRGERRVYYSSYRITKAGRKRLSEGQV